MILVTGASGALGTLVVERLAGVSTVTAGSRTPANVTATVPTRHIDFDQPATLASAFRGVDTLVMISAGYADDDVVIARHGAAADAADAAGVSHVVYTSLIGAADHTTLAVAHRWTEARLAAGRATVTILRNGLYPQIPAGLAALATPPTNHDLVRAPWGSGTVATVTRENLADVAATVAAQVDSDLTAGRQPRHESTYELDGTAAYSGVDVAAALTERRGRPVRYEAVPLGAVWPALAASGLKPYQVGHAMSILSNVGAGLLAGGRSDLPRLLDAPPRDVLEPILALFDQQSHP